MSNDQIKSVKNAGIGLLIVGILNAVISFASLAGGVVRFSGIMGPVVIPADEAQRVDFLSEHFSVTELA